MIPTVDQRRIIQEGSGLTVVLRLKEIEDGR